VDSLIRAIRSRLPRRDTIHHYRLLRPFADRLAQPNLWKLNRRSVPRAVALGLGIGILLPVMHMALAALLAIPTRANIAIAAAFTLLINPVTIPPIYYAAWRVGAWELHERAAAHANPGVSLHGHAEGWLALVWHASGPIALGIVTLAVLAAAAGYLISSAVWRWQVGNRWQSRRR
jgi:uncharacterized protein (DUF2062 family)